MNALILAAGRGTRLAPFTDDRPKALVDIDGRSILSRLIEALRAAGGQRLVVACRAPLHYAGRGVETIVTGETSSQVETLLRAWDAIEHGDEPWVVTYADLLVETRLFFAIRGALLPSDCEIAVLVDTDWSGYFRWRFDGSLGDAEWLRIADSRIVEIGGPFPQGQVPGGQFIGILRLTQEGFNVVNSYWSMNRPESLDTTALLGRLVANGVGVAAVPVRGGWLEVDTELDLGGAERVLSGREQVPFFTPERNTWLG